MIKDSLYHEIQSLNVGDLIMFGGSIRMIRRIMPYSSKRSPNRGMPFWYVFAIRRPSWTGKVHTMYSYYEMRQQYKHVVKRNIPLVREGNKLEAVVQYHIDNLIGSTKTDMNKLKRRAPNMYLEAGDMYGVVL